VYPNLTEEDKSAISQFVKLYKDNIGYNETIHGGESFIPTQEEIPENQLFNIRQMLTDESHPNSRIKNFYLILSKMTPNKAKLLTDLIKSSISYQLAKRDNPPSYRKKSKSPKPKRKSCIDIYNHALKIKGKIPSRCTVGEKPTKEYTKKKCSCKKK